MCKPSPCPARCGGVSPVCFPEHFSGEKNPRTPTCPLSECPGPSPVCVLPSCAPRLAGGDPSSPSATSHLNGVLGAEDCGPEPSIRTHTCVTLHMQCTPACDHTHPEHTENHTRVCIIIPPYNHTHCLTYTHIRMHTPTDAFACNCTIIHTCM